jgi:hypothetical protein
MKHSRVDKRERTYNATTKHAMMIYVIRSRAAQALFRSPVASSLSAMPASARWADMTDGDDVAGVSGSFFGAVVSCPGGVVEKGGCAACFAGGFSAEISGAFCADETNPKEEKIPDEKMKPHKKTRIFELTRIYITNNDSNLTNTILVGEQSTAAYLKYKVSKRHKVPLEKLTLLWKGRVLKDHEV